ncbi:MAG: DUF4411 family protein [Chloroflexi bacterium]|nr:DUF4411 family protein [Chloroflexota bacterium]
MGKYGLIQFWLDADSPITPSRGPYRFSFGTALWDFLHQQADEKLIGSSTLVLGELRDGDELAQWARQQVSLFIVPDDSVQRAFSEVADKVNGAARFQPQHVQAFLSGADPWIIAHARAYGGRIVTFEKPEPASTKPKIPDVASAFGLSCLSLWDMLGELGFRA